MVRLGKRLNVVNGEAQVNMSVQGTSTQLYQYGFEIRAGARYQLTFRARNSLGDDVSARVIQHAAPYMNLGVVFGADLADEWREFTVQFTATAGASSARLQLYMGPYDRDGTGYSFDEIVLQEVVTGSGPSPTP